jgi:phage-related baseplate assembly protein
LTANDASEALWVALEDDDELEQHSPLLLAGPTMKTTASQATTSVQLCCGHSRDLSLDQTWHRLFRWWRLGLGREALGSVWEG